ncbi:MAG: hypothetical protein HKO11_02645 [Eudoraea sp.]|nr:hypothetical protein [Eudoraea sp.]NNK30466.1 hypothetical protein [Flavobacteriaceae bacterium]
MKRVKLFKSLSLVALLFAFLTAGALTSCRDTKKKEDAEQTEAAAEAGEHPEGEEHPSKEGKEHPEGEEHPTKEGDEHPAGEEHPTKKDSVSGE